MSGSEEGMGTRMEKTLQQGSPMMRQPQQELTPEGLGMQDFGEHALMEDIMDRLQSDPTFKGKIKDLLSR